MNEIDRQLEAARYAPVGDRSPSTVIARGHRLRRRRRGVGGLAAVAVAVMAVVAGIGLVDAPEGTDDVRAGAGRASSETTAPEPSSETTNPTSSSETTAATEPGGEAATVDVVFPDGSRATVTGPADMRIGPAAAVPAAVLVLDDGSGVGSQVFVRRGTVAEHLAGAEVVASYPGADGVSVDLYTGGPLVAGFDLLVFVHDDWLVGLMVQADPAIRPTPKQLAQWAAKLQLTTVDGYLVLVPSPPVAFAPQGDMGAPHLEFLGDGWDASITPGGCTGREGDGRLEGYSVTCSGTTRVEVYGADATAIADSIGVTLR